MDMRIAALASFVPLLLAGCERAPAKPEYTGPEAAFLVENAQAMDRMMSGMEVQPTGDVDRDFARMMIPHHQGAVDMAKALLRHGKNPELRALAESIVATQQDEIALMRRVIGEPAGSAPPPSGKPHNHMKM